LYKALVIGCGNIGALYDLDNNKVHTHARAYHLNAVFSFDVFDIDKTLAEKIASAYSCGVVEELTDETLRDYDCISICTPTGTHAVLLNQAMNAGVKVIVCEKPVSNNTAELEQLTAMYSSSTSRILVNYIRRFQPAYQELNQYIATLLLQEKLTNISIRYQRGFINNCSHAIDLLEYLTARTFTLSSFTKGYGKPDQFENDPTFSLDGLWNDSHVSICGLADVRFAHFEIDLFFEYHKIVIREAGSTIEVYQAAKSERNFMPLLPQPELSRHNCLDHYMTHVIAEAQQLLDQPARPDNFISAIRMNSNLLSYLP
jgi:predicted dehydrogenase